MIDARLLEVIACPQCHSTLEPASEAPTTELVCTSAECALRYPVRNGIPVLLIDEALSAD